MYFLSDNTGCCEIELTHNHVLPENGYTNGTAFGHLAFEIDDFNKFSEKLLSFGFEYERPPFKLGDVGKTIAFIKDPDGTAIELI